MARRSVLLAVSLAIAVFPARASTQVRLDEEGDRLAFRAWFTLLADAAYYRPVAEVTDCAALVRYAARESLRAHTPEWLRLAKLPVAAGLPELTHRPAVVANHFPLFRVSSDPHVPYTEFADARTLVRYNARLIARDVGAARPGDLLYYLQPSQNEPDHLMIFIGESRFDRSAGDFVVYHTGKDDLGGPGDVRKVRLADLLRHPSPRWRPLASNPNFVGVFRLVMIS